MTSLDEYKSAFPEPLRQASLCILLKEGKILLALKKRRFGMGKWNGIGGKRKEDETIEQSAIRESQEETGIIITSMRKVATMNFYFPQDSANKDWNQQVIVFVVDKWDGEPAESEEMLPKWFNLSEIPYDEMWDDDKHWLPKVLEGKVIEADFLFGGDQKIQEFRIKEVT